MKPLCSTWLFAVAAGICILLAAVDHASAAAGIFGSDIGLQSNNINSGTITFFEADLLGDSRHAPATNTPVLLDARGFNGLNLGTFNPLAGDTLLLVGGETLTYKNDSSDITSSALSYSIDGSNTFSNINLPFNQDKVNGTAGDQRWALTSGTVDILANLGVGNHTLTFYTSATTNGVNTFSTLYDTNSGKNFTASFTVVPEPGTWMGALLLVLTASALLLRRFGFQLLG